MRDLSKTKIVESWHANNGTPLMELRVGKRKAKYICFMLERVPLTPPGVVPDIFEPKKYAPRDFRDMRMSELRKAAQQIAEMLEENQVKQSTAEVALDLIYAELNRRLNKVTP